MAKMRTWKYEPSVQQWHELLKGAEIKVNAAAACRITTTLYKKNQIFVFAVLGFSAITAACRITTTLYKKNQTFVFAVLGFSAITAAACRITTTLYKKNQTFVFAVLGFSAITAAASTLLPHH